MRNLLFSLAEVKPQFHPHSPSALWLKGTLLEVSNVVLAQWVIMALLIALAVAVNRVVLSGRPSRLRTALELLIDFLEGWYSSFIGGRKNARRFMPLLGSLFLFIIASNYLGLVPTVGYARSLYAPTGSWGTTLGLALVVAFTCQYVAIRELGIGGWLKHLGHLFGMGLLEEFVRPFSLSLRLFGNIFAEEILLGAVIYLVQGIAPIPIMVLSLLFGAIQAVVFTTMSAIYIGMILEHAEHAAH